MPRRPWTYSPRSGRFHAPTGRFLSAKDVRDAVDKRLDAASREIKAVSEAYRRGEITGAEWMQRMRSSIRETHVMSALAAKGGREGLTQRDYGVLGQRIRQQYQYLTAFARDLNAGIVTTDGRFLQRAASYSQASRGSFDHFDREEKVRIGYDEERNILDREAAHCEGPGSCPEQTALGWVPVGALIPLTQRRCGVSDRCRIQFRNSRTGQVAA